MRTWFLFTCVIICTTTANVFEKTDVYQFRADSPVAPHYHGNPLYGEFILPKQKKSKRKQYLNLYGCRSASCEVGDVPTAGKVNVPLLVPPPAPVVLHELTPPEPKHNAKTQGGAVNFILYNEGVKYKQRERSKNELDEVKLKFNCILIADKTNSCYGWNVDKKQDDKKQVGSKKSRGKKQKKQHLNANDNPSGDHLPLSSGDHLSPSSGDQLPPSFFVRNNVVARGSRRGRVTLRAPDTSSYVNINV